MFSAIMAAGSRYSGLVNGRLVHYREAQVERRVLCQLIPKGLLANLTAWQALGPRALTEVSQPACPHGFQGDP